MGMASSRPYSTRPGYSTTAAVAAQPLANGHPTAIRPLSNWPPDAVLLQHRRRPAASKNMSSSNTGRRPAEAHPGLRLQG